jgi:hypothetical protein
METLLLVVVLIQLVVVLVLVRKLQKVEEARRTHTRIAAR